MDDRTALADEAEKLLAGGFRAIKLRLGYPTLAQDIAAVHAVRKRIGDGVKLMVDYNQALSVDEALTRGRALDGEDIYWLEEPIRHDDYLGAVKARARIESPGSDRRELLVTDGDVGCARCAGRRLRDAGSRTHRRRDRMA